MARTLLVRGMLVGALAGLLALAFAVAFGEPQVAEAVRLEEAAGGDHAHAPVSRLVQATVGLGLAVVVFAAAVGGVFGLAFGFAHGRLGRLGARGTALAVAGLGFVSVALVPSLKYPANPPGVESTQGMRERTALYFLLVLITALAAVGALIVARSLAARFGGWNGATAAALGFLAVVAALTVLLPGGGSHSDGFPAELLWRFRLASIGTQAVLWAALGLLFGALTDRAERRAGVERRPVEHVA